MSAFDAALYDPIRAGAQDSAKVVVPLIMDMADLTANASVVDVGCGEGWWGVEFATQGCKVIGVDGSEWPGGHQLDEIGERYVQTDLTQPLPVEQLGRFGLVICLEVAEHLPESRADSFVHELCALADVVVFSAAIPHQSGAGHINCQWQSWWARLFGARGFHPNVALRSSIWNDDRIEPWYRQNIVAYAPYGTFDDNDGPLDVVHPIIHEWGRS